MLFLFWISVNNNPTTFLKLPKLNTLLIIMKLELVKFWDFIKFMMLIYDSILNYWEIL